MQRPHTLTLTITITNLSISGELFSLLLTILLRVIIQIFKNKTLRQHKIKFKIRGITNIIVEKASINSYMLPKDYIPTMPRPLKYIVLRTRLTFHISSTGGPPYIIPLVFGWQTLPLPRRAGGRGTVKVLCICFIWKVLRIRLRILTSWISQCALLSTEHNKQRKHSGTYEGNSNFNDLKFLLKTLRNTSLWICLFLSRVIFLLYLYL